MRELMQVLEKTKLISAIAIGLRRKLSHLKT